MTPEFPESGPGSKKRRRWFLITLALVTCIGLYVARDVLLPFLMAVVTAYVLSPVVNAGERLQFRGTHPRRWIVVLSLYTALIGSTTIGAVVATPRLTAELGKLAREAPRLVREGRNEWIPAIEAWLQKTSALYLKPFESAGGVKVVSAPPQPVTGPRLDPAAVQIRPRGDGGYEVALPPQGLRVVPDGDNAYRIMPAPPHAPSKGDLRAALDDVLGGALDNTERSAMSVFVAARNLLVKFSRGVFGFVLTLMLSAYLLITKDRIFEFFRQLYRPNRRDDFDELLGRIDRGLAGVVRGQLMICLINGVLSGIGFWLLDLKYWIFLTVLATVMSLIPIFGSILSTVPAVLIALPEGMTHALLVLGWIIAIHQLEANVLNPKVMGDAARVHPVLVVFALLAGEHFGGILGALLAVPVLSITQTVFLHLRERFLGVPRASTLPPPPPAVPAAAQATTQTTPDAAR